MAEETGIGTGAAGTGTGGVEPNGTGTQPNNGGADPGKSNGTSNGDTNPNIERLIQAAVDRATNKLGNENKKLKNQIQQLQTLNMTDAEKHEHEMSEREKALRDGEAELKAEKNKFYAMTAIKKAGLDDGTDTALELIELVMAEDEKAIDAKVESMKSLVNKLVTAEVNKTFAQNGRQPGTSNSNGDDKAKSSAAVAMGKKAAAANKASQSILDYYTGGKK
ncbi:MAG: DUF4355 domain-containing protein [Monoglobales bacterium]